MSEIQQYGQKLRGERIVTLADGKDYICYYSINSIIDLQTKYKSLANVFKEFEKGQAMDFKVFRDFLYYGLKTRQPEMTVEELGDLIDFFNFESIMTQVFGSVTDALPSNDQQG